MYSVYIATLYNLTRLLYHMYVQISHIYQNNRDQLKSYCNELQWIINYKCWNIFQFIFLVLNILCWIMWYVKSPMTSPMTSNPWHRRRYYFDVFGYYGVLSKLNYSVFCTSVTICGGYICTQREKIFQHL
jgi:hypothetical protein